jgi:hypothetical protein
MIRSIHALVLAAGMLGLVGSGFGQDPVTERPGQPPAKPAPMPAAQQPAPAPAPAARPIVTLEGHEEWGNYGELTFHLFQSGKATMIDATKKPVHGTVKVEGNRMKLIFGNCVYEANENNGVISGKARYTSGTDAGKSWNFRLTIRNPLINRTFTGNETLPGYGAVSFRFVNANTVEMIDRDGVMRGAYAHNGLQVTMTFGATTYTGDIRGDAIAGSARDSRSNWTFQVNAK